MTPESTAPHVGAVWRYADQHETKLYRLVGRDGDTIQVRNVDAPPNRCDIFRVSLPLDTRFWTLYTDDLTTERRK